jgi:hypothetical protein
MLTESLAHPDAADICIVPRDYQGTGGMCPRRCRWAAGFPRFRGKTASGAENKEMRNAGGAVLGGLHRSVFILNIKLAIGGYILGDVTVTVLLREIVRPPPRHARLLGLILLVRSCNRA